MGPRGWGACFEMLFQGWGEAGGRKAGFPEMDGDHFPALSSGTPGGSPCPLGTLGAPQGAPTPLGALGASIGPMLLLWDCAERSLRLMGF